MLRLALTFLCLMGGCYMPESTQVKSVSVPDASVVKSEILKENKISSIDLGGPYVNSEWIINYIAITFKSAKLEIQKGKTGKTTPIARLLSGNVVLAEVQGDAVNIKKNASETLIEFAPLTIAFNFAQPPAIAPGQTITVEIELSTVGGNITSASLREGKLSMGYTQKRIR